MKEYSEYKSSGVEWIGDIPYDWKISKFNRVIIRMSTGLNPRDNFKLGDGDCYYVTIKNFKKGKLFLDEKCDRITKEAVNIINERSNLKINDILFSSIGEEAEAYLINEHPTNWNINESVFAIRVNKNILLPKFFYYLITNKSFFDNLIKDATGSTFKSIKINSLKEKKVPVPYLSVQDGIVIFLDNKTEKIGALISGKEKLVELLKEQRQSIISETVTKGLDKKTEMKPSGVEWIGNIPITWEIKKMKYIAELYPKYRVSSAVNDMDVTFSPMECVRTGILEQRLSKFSNYSSSYNIFKNGDILMAKLISCFENGNIVIAKDLSNGIGFGSSELFIIRCFGVNTEYMFYYFQNNTFVEMAKSTTQGVTLKRVSVDFIKNSQIPIPDREEQKKIVSYLNEKTSQIGNLIENLTKQIKKLQEYRKSIVSEAVTGKVAI